MTVLGGLFMIFSACSSFDIFVTMGSEPGTGHAKPAMCGEWSVRSAVVTRLLAKQQ